MEKCDSGENQSALNVQMLRNITILSPESYDKKKLLDSFLSSPGTLPTSEEDFSADSDATSFYYEVQSNICKGQKSSEQSDKGQTDDRYLINIVDIPGHTDAPCQATSTLTVADGCILIVDETVSLHQEGIIKHAVNERIRPVLAVNILDSWFEMPRTDLAGEKAYQALIRAVKKTNAKMETYDDKLLVDLTFKPEKGTVAFTSLSYGWGFTLTGFAQMFADVFELEEPVLRKKMWTGEFYDNATKQWTSHNTGSPSCIRGFVQFCYKPIMTVIDYCMMNQKAELQWLLKSVGVTFEEDIQNAKGKELLEMVMQTWLPASKALLGMVVTHLPSPAKAQSYRVENMYKGPLNDRYACSVRKCDPSGPLLVFIAKEIQSQEAGNFGVVARVFSGTIKKGMEVKVMGPNHSVQSRGLHTQKVEEVYMWKERRKCQVEDAQAGAIVMLYVNVECLPLNATLTNLQSAQAYPIKAMNIILENNESLQDVTFNPLDGEETRHFTLPYSVYNGLFLYQREGVHWLWKMFQSHLPGSILADDMGLGKTRQVCSFLRGLFHSNLIKKVIVVAPNSVVHDWVPELVKVGIQNVKLFTSAKANRRNLNSILKDGGVLVTTYGVFQRNLEIIEITDDDIWDYVIMDEGHRAKERNGEISESLKHMKCKHKVIMTGTPMQNNLEEFFTLVDVCNPGFLGGFYDEFYNRFVFPIERGKYSNSSSDAIIEATEALHNLKDIVAPFVLRRTKELLKSIGSMQVDKFEYIIWLELSPAQKEYYKTLVSDSILREPKTALAATDVAKDICRHPILLMPKQSSKGQKAQLERVKNRKVAQILKENLLNASPVNMPCQEDLTRSNKLSFIVYIVPKMIAEEHKILIFSQSPEMLKLIQHALEGVMDKQDIIRMDGSTKRPERDRLKQIFQAHPCKGVFG